MTPCKTNKKKLRVKRRNWCHLIGLDSHFQKITINPKNTNSSVTSAFSSWWVLKLSKSKPGCRVSALHFLREIDSIIDFWLRAHSDKCIFQLLIPGSTPVSLLEGKPRFKIDTQHADTEKKTIFTSIVSGSNWPFSTRRWYLLRNGSSCRYKIK